MTPANGTSPIGSAAKVLIVPMFLLIITTALQWQLGQPWTEYQVDFGPFAPPAPDEPMVGSSLLGFRLYEPSAMLARANTWSALAAGTIVLSILALIALWRFRTIPARERAPSDAFWCTWARWLPWVALLAFPLYMIEVARAVYLAEVLVMGAPMYFATALAVVFAPGLVAFPIAFRGTHGIELPPQRLNAMLLRREAQPQLSTLCVDYDVHLAASIEPVTLMFHGNCQCGDETVLGNVLLVPLTLCAITTEAELRCLVVHACMPLKWIPLVWEME